VLNVVSHEHNETMTDPLGTGWFDGSGYENGDECAWVPVTTSWNGYGDYDQTINANAYFLQMEWSNRAGSCALRNSYPQPTASFTVSSNPVAGRPVTFTSAVNDSDDTAFTYRWSFGDGATSVSPSPTHTFAATGSYRVSLVVFDAHGDQKLVKKTVSVA
jgi:PKD repeat protein